MSSDNSRNYIKLAGTAGPGLDYNLGGIIGQNQFVNINRINLVCDTTIGPINIQLPKITDLRGFTNFQVLVDHAAGNAGTYPITITVGDPGDNICGHYGVTLNVTNQKMLFEVASVTTDWTVWQSGCCAETWHDEYFDSQTSDPGVVASAAFIDQTKPFQVIVDGAVAAQSSADPEVIRDYTLVDRTLPEVGTNVIFTNPLVDAQVHLQYFSTDFIPEP